MRPLRKPVAVDEHGAEVGVDHRGIARARFLRMRDHYGAHSDIGQGFAQEARRLDSGAPYVASGFIFGIKGPAGTRRYVLDPDGSLLPVSLVRSGDLVRFQRPDGTFTRDPRTVSTTDPRPTKKGGDRRG